MAAFERATVGLFLWWSANAALARNPCAVVSVRRLTVGEAAERIEAGARARGLKVLARTDHSALARSDGYRLRPVQSLLVDGAHAADPIRLVVWQSLDGTTRVALDRRLQDGAQSPLATVLPALLESLGPAGRTLPVA